MKSQIYFFFFLFLLLLFFNPTVVGEKEELFLEENFKIVMPTISLEADICSFEREACLELGVWKKYWDERGNILLTGHSFTLVPFGAGVFYSLSEVGVGDSVYIFLEEDMLFKIEEVFVTNRYDLSVEDFSGQENTLVIYSCFPLWSASERIVVRGTLVNLL